MSSLIDTWFWFWLWLLSLIQRLGIANNWGKEWKYVTWSLGWLFHCWTIQWTLRRKRLCRGLCPGTPFRNRVPRPPAPWRGSLLESFWPWLVLVAAPQRSRFFCFRVELRPPPWAEACSWLKATCGCKAFLLLLPLLLLLRTTAKWHPPPPQLQNIKCWPNN